MKKVILLIVIFVSTVSFSQVGIGTSNPSDKSILDLNATDRGFLLPRMSAAQRIGIIPNASTDKGLQVFDTSTNSIWFWNGTIWVQQGSNNIYDSNGTIKAGRLVGITDNVNFDNNTFYLDGTNNRVGVGTNIPTELFEVSGKTKTVTFQLTNGASQNAILVSDALGNATWDTSFKQSGTVVMSVGSSNIFTTTISSGFITVTANNDCGRPMIALFVFNGNSMIHLNSVARNSIGNASSLNADNTSWGVTFTGVQACLDGGSGSQFDFAISKNGNLITLSGYTYTNNKAYTISVNRL